jgi:hypothetical protein
VGVMAGVAAGAAAAEETAVESGRLHPTINIRQAKTTALWRMNLTMKCTRI